MFPRNYLSTIQVTSLVEVVIRENEFLAKFINQTVGCMSPCSKFMVAVVYELLSLVSSSDIQEIVFVAQFY